MSGLRNSRMILPMMALGSAAVCLWMTACTTTIAAEADTGQFVDHIYRDADGDHKYVVFVPVGYSPANPPPVIFYLHGASGRGRDGRAQLVVGLGPGLKQRAATTPFLAVFAQNEDLRSRLLGGWHDDTRELERALKIQEEVERNYVVNKDHRVLVGISMGAFGAWSLAAKDPSPWKAVLPLSGGGKPDFIPNLAKVPVWAFHAADDTLVPQSASTDLIDGINAAGGRGFVSILPTGGHNIGNHVFGQDEVWDWMLHPEKPAVTDIDWPKRPSAASLIDELKFVPGAEVERAILIRVNTDLLESMSYLIPDQVPVSALNGARAGTYEHRGQGLMAFDVATHGIQYTGTMERAWVTPQAGNRLRIQLGLRNLVTTVMGTNIDSPLFRASAGPMQIVLGEREPIWLTADVIPRVENRRIRLELAGVDFQVPQDNWGIRGPGSVRVRPLPFLEDRVTQRLVTGLAEKKAEIEREIRNSVPRMIAQMEDRLATMTDRTVSYARFPMPLWQPRFRFYPEVITVDEGGLTLQLGAQVAALAPRSDHVPIRPVPAGDEARPTTVGQGLEVAVSPRMVTAWGSLLAASDVARFHILDMADPQFRSLGTREFWQTVLPGDERIAKATELETEFVLMSPLALSSLPAADGEQNGKPAGFRLEIPKLQLQLASREPGRPLPQPLVEVDFGIIQPIKMAIDKPSFAMRKMQMSMVSGPTPTVVPRHIDAPANAPAFDQEKLAAQFQAGWNETFTSFAMANQLKDMSRGGMTLRWEAADWTGQHFQVRLQRPAIRVRNSSDQPVEYQVRGTQSPWSETLKLAPGEFHEFRPPTALTWRSIMPAETSQFTLPLGFEAKIKSAHPLRVVQGEAAATK